MTIIYVLIALFAVLCVFIAMRPSEFTVSRTATIDAPVQTVFNQVNELRNWESWSPWAKIDPACVMTYEGPEAGNGAAYSWSGNNKVGAGHMAITESQSNNLVRFKLDFLRPFKATNTALFTFKPEGDKTIVTWSMSGKNNFVSKAIGLFINCEKMCGSQFEKGLDQLNSTVQTALVR